MNHENFDNENGGGMDFSGVDVPDDSPSLPPQGTYMLAIVSGRRKDNGDIGLMLRVLDPGKEHHRASVWDNLFPQPVRNGKANAKGRERVAMYLDAAGVPRTNVQLPQSLIGKIVVAKVMHEKDLKDETKMRAKIGYAGVKSPGKVSAETRAMVAELVAKEADRAKNKAATAAGVGVGASAMMDDTFDDPGDDY